VELNIVRVNSGKLPPLSLIPPNMATFIDELLYERRYSLMMEGHRWIDARRLGRMSALPIFIAHDADKKEVPDTLNVRFPIPQPECDARPGEPRCALGSTD
jgi:starch-binding outer membrane protein, SusD/RagB family